MFFSTVTLFTRIVQFSLSAYLLIMTGVVSFLISDFFIPAEIPMSITILNPKIHPNEPIKYLAVFKRIKSCRTEVQRFIVTHDTRMRYSNIPVEQVDPGATPVPRQEYLPTSEGVEEVGYRDSIIGVINQGPQSIIKTVSIMKHPWLRPGKYTLRNFAFSQCSLISRVDPYPEVEFEVIDELEIK